MYTVKTPFDACLEAILTAHTIESEINAAKKLAQIYEQLLQQIVKDEQYQDTNPTHIDGGVALSSRHALDCLDDPLRTVRFIAGAYAALQDTLNTIKERPLQVVYAGCGPGAPLLLPFLHEFDKDQIDITLLDLNTTSLQSVKALIDHLDLHAYFRGFELVDAVTYEHPKNLGLHFVISETMDKGFTREPQVRVTQNMVAQLHPDGMFIPEAIDLYTEHTFYGKEPYFDIYKKHADLPPVYSTIDRALLFTIDKHVHNDPPFEFESEPLKVPEDYSQTPDVAVFAEVRIYKDYILEKSESLLSNPVCILSLNNVSSSHYILKHTTQGTPDWELIQV
ncbi:MAG: hypothetical protein ABJM06_00800 [Gilvibacter sp.]